MTAPLGRGFPQVFPDPEVSIASATITDIGKVSSENILITGTNTINSFGVAAKGVTKKIRFSGALTLTYNATSMIILGLVNRTTAANDCAEVMSLGSGNWIFTKYATASGKGLLDGITTIASGSLSGTSVTVTDIPQTYSKLAVFVSGASSDSASAGTRVDLQLSTNNGSSYDTTAGNYSGLNIDEANAVVANTIASATMVGALCLSTDTATFNINLDAYQAGPYTQISGRMTTTSLSKTYQCLGTYLSTSGVNALRLILNNGSFDAGTYAVYGIS